VKKKRANRKVTKVDVRERKLDQRTSSRKEHALERPTGVIMTPACTLTFKVKSFLSALLLRILLL
jgi:hypothetical protein